MLRYVVQKNSAMSWAENTTPFSETYADIYYAEEDGFLEGRHTFINGNQLTERGSFRIAELGFGTGLNYVTTRLDLGNKITNYFAVERAPVSEEIIRTAFARWPQLHEETEKFLADYAHRQPGWNYWGQLHLYVGDVQDFLNEMISQQQIIDAWFLDGFNPAKNPEMWNEEVTLKMAKCSQVGTTFATFTVAGFVKRNLKTAGFKIEKRKGFGRKREMLAGIMANA